MSLEIPELLHAKSWFIEKHFAGLQHPLLEHAKKLTLMSDYAAKHVSLLKMLLMEDSCEALYTRADYFQALSHLSNSLTHAAYAMALRQFRNRHFLRLLLLELSGLTQTEYTMRAWSDCADALILHALAYCKHSMHARYGLPRDAEGSEASLLTLAMGKLGGRELNYSSDIDLIFAYSAAGETDGEERIDNLLYFNKLVQQFSLLLQNVTPDGFVFRVDLRLRPHGDSGTLVPSLSAMETYYQEQGRDWERYAMVKARVISKSIDTIHPWFERLVTPFVYRRYVDFSVIESLRGMKAMIEREVQLNPRLDDLKRGKGGIRELEFVIQSFQLIRGGRLPQLQSQNALTALAALKREKLLHHSDALKQAYLFLRRLENVLQSVNDQQTHSLPDDAVKQSQVFWAMGYSSWDKLLEKLQQYQRIISYAFHSVLGKADDYEDKKRVLANQLASLWQGHVETSMAINLLTSLGYENAEHCYQMIHAFRHSPRCRRLSQAARMRLDHLMVLLLTELTQIEHTDRVLLQVMHLLENIVGRSAYLALLTENLPVVTELLFWFAHSPFISSLFVNQPFLLEVLLDQDQQWKPQSRRQLEQMLEEQLTHHLAEIEVQEELLRQFKLVNWLMAARAELYGFCDAVRIGQFLSDLAQVIVNRVFILATEQLAQRYPEMKLIQAHFAIIAYGKLGSREMNYASDLDLVFVHDVVAVDESTVTRLTQKILHMLTTRSQAGVLYTVDTRLRPSGSAGLLVSPMDAFVAYQKKQAWTWEHQALIRARIVVGNARMKRIFLHLKQEVLTQAREVLTLKQDVISMRAKMDQHQDATPLRLITSGLVDLEFLVQFLILAARRPGLARFTHTQSLLRHLCAADCLTKEHYTVLTHAYKKYHDLLHKNLLRPDDVIQEQECKQAAVIYEYFLS